MGKNCLCKLTYVNIEGAEHFNEINNAVYERAVNECKKKITDISENISVILSPYISLYNDEIVSVRYDLLCMRENVVASHKRFCINEFYKRGLFVLCDFVKSKKRIGKEFYLYEECGQYFAVCVKASLTNGYVITRWGEIDKIVDSVPIPIKIQLPKFISEKFPVYPCIC